MSLEFLQKLIMIRTIRSSLYLAVFAMALSASTLAQGKVTLTWQVEKYDISVQLPSEAASNRDINVTAALTLKNIGKSSYPRLTMRISPLAEISSVTANGSAADFVKEQESTGGADSLQRIVSRIPAVASGQTTVVTVKYRFNIKENSGLSSLSAIGTQMLPLSFWYPTPTSWFYTGGADFAPIRMSVSAPSGVRVVSSGTESSGAFDLKLSGQPFFVAGNYESSTVDGVEMDYLRRGAVPIKQGRLAEVAAIANKANAFLGGKLRMSLGVPLRVVFVKRGAGFSDSGVVFVDDSVLVREKLDSQAVTSIVEGIAKTYLGNVVKVGGEGYGVIREGLSRYLSNEFLGQEFGEAAASVEMLQQRTNYSTIARRDAPLSQVSPVDGYYYLATANKGALIWNYLADTFGDDFFDILKARADDGVLELDEIRESLAPAKAYLDYTIDRVTEMNLMIGLPQRSGDQVKSALRNLGDIDATVVVAATTSSGKVLKNTVTIPAKSFGEVAFDTSEKVVRVEVDESKKYPQVDFSDDVAPRVIEDPDPILFIKKDFDRQRYAEAAANAEKVLAQYPAFDDARILLARSFLGENKLTESQRQYEQVIGSALPSPQSLAWAELGLGEIAAKSGRTAEARERYKAAIAADAEYGTTLGAVRNLITLGGGPSVDDSVKTFFTTFDRVVISNSKAEVQAIIEPGEVSRFAANVAGQAQEWATTPVFSQAVDEADILVAVNITLRLINKDPETGMALFRLTRTASGLKLSGVEIFEVG